MIRKKESGHPSRQRSKNHKPDATATHKVFEHKKRETRSGEPSREKANGGVCSILGALST